MAKFKVGDTVIIINDLTSYSKKNDICVITEISEISTVFKYFLNDEYFVSESEINYYYVRETPLYKAIYGTD